MSIGSEARSHGEAGLTLIELLVVLAIVASVLAVSVPSLRGDNSELRMRLEVQKIAAALKGARVLSIADGRPVAFTFDGNANSWMLEGHERPSRLPESMTITLETARQAIGDEAEGRIVFFPDGSATGGRVTLRHRSSSVAIEINWLTGAVAITRGRP